MLGATGRLIAFTGRDQQEKTVELAEVARAVDVAARALCAGLGEEELAWRPHPQKWSIAENLAHLRATNAVFLPAIDSALKASRRMGQCHKKALVLGPFGRLVVWRIESRPILKMRAPEILEPRLLGPSHSELEHFLTSQGELRERMAAAHGLDLTAWRFSSPVARYIRLNLLEFFSAINAHSRRHLRQAHCVRQAMQANKPRRLA